MSRKGVLVLVLLVVLVLSAMVGCGGSTTTTKGGSATTAASATTTKAAATTTVASATSTTAAAGTTTTAAATTTTKGGGASGTTATVASTNGGYPTTNVPDWSQIKSVMAFRSASYGVASIWVILANYDVKAATLSDYNALPSPGAGQGQIEILFTRTLANQNEPPLIVGKYDFSKAQGTAELTGEGTVLVEKGTGIQFMQGGLVKNDMQITAISATEISGTFSLGDKWTAMSGTFTAPLK
jgi:hypothetical protein